MVGKRPILSGFRGVLIYIAVGLALTGGSYVLIGQSAAEAVGLVFLVGALVAFPWIAGRATLDEH